MTAAAPAPAVVVDGLVKRYGGRAVVDGVSLTVAAGELVALLGPNGAGKTTTVETVEGYRRPDRGVVRILGEDPAAGSRALRARVGVMLQGGGFDPRARARETLVQYARLHAAPEDPDALLGRLGLDHVAGTAVRRLSGGERQRLGLAVALVGRPDVLVLDEPTAGMDPEARAATRAVVAERRAAGAAILLTSHDLADVERLADRIVVIDRGRIVASGGPAALAALAHPSLRIRLDAPLDAAGVRLVAERLAIVAPAARLVPELAERVGEDRRQPPDAGADGRYRVDGADPSPELVAALALACAELGRLLVESRAGAGTLEESYLALVERAREEAS